MLCVHDVQCGEVCWTAVQCYVCVTFSVVRFVGLQSNVMCA